MDYIIGEAQNGKTVLAVLKCDMGISNAAVKHLKFKKNGICIGGEQVTVRRVVHTGDVLTLATEDTKTPEKLTPCALPLSIAYEDEDTVVPDKPANMPTHQSHGHYGDTVANALAFRYTQKGEAYVFRPVNRLDRNTSGLLLIARSRLSAAFLANAMQNGQIHKRYIAVLCGHLPNKRGVIDTYMRRTAESIIVREVCSEGEGGDRAITEYEVICESDTHTMVCAKPITGRTHQLRVHFAYLGAPIEGDDLYGSASTLIDRHALHSFSLSFPRKGGEIIHVTAPLHDDMRALAVHCFGEALSSSESEFLKLILPDTEETVQ